MKGCLRTYGHLKPIVRRLRFGAWRLALGQTNGSCIANGPKADQTRVARVFLVGGAEIMKRSLAEDDGEVVPVHQFRALFVSRSWRR